MLKYLTVLILLLTVVVVMRLDEFSVSNIGQQQTLNIQHREDSLAGTLILPEGVTFPPVVVLVHGDGAQDRWSEGGYLPLVNFLVEEGIAVFSWDKPGIGESRGNWLAQTMDDRADEAATVLHALRQEPALRQSQAGFLGFSQAGWVVPAASDKAQADFAILIGPAINWRDQGFYYLRQRLTVMGKSKGDIAKAVENDTTEFERQFTPDIVSRPCSGQCNREDFERRNAFSDARETISSLHTPVMILMGEHDRNVGPTETLDIWKSTLPEKTPHCFQLVDGATHGLLRSGWFDYQLTSQWPWWKQGIFLLSGREAYAPGALSRISGWALHRECQR